MVGNVDAPRRGFEWPDLGLDVSRSFRLALALDQDRAGGGALRQFVAAGIRWMDCGTGASLAEIERRTGAILSGLAAAASVGLSTTLQGEISTAPLATRSAPAEWPASAGSLFSGDPEQAPREVEEATERAARRLGRPRLSAVWVRAEEVRSLELPKVRRVLDAMAEVGGPLATWGVRFPPRAVDPSLMERAVGLRPPLLAAPIHLINAAETLAWRRAARAASTSIVALDPFAGGLLDGRRLDPARRGAAAAPMAPPTWTELRDAFEPVRRLAFLTTERRRTLPAASLLYLWHSPDVASVLVTPEAPTELAAWLSARTAPPLSSEERAGIERSARPSPRADGGARLK